jgi:cytochrome c oxidase assembly factor CtaG
MFRWKHILRLYLSCISDVCCKCLIWSDVVKVDQVFHMLQCTCTLQLYVRNVSFVLVVCCKCLIKMFHMFQMYVASVLSACCICCSGYIHMLQVYVPNVSSIFWRIVQQVSSVSCIKRWIRRSEQAGRMDSLVRAWYRAGVRSDRRHRRSPSACVTEPINLYEIK